MTRSTRSTRLLPLAAALCSLFALATTGCATSLQPHALDVGRGAAPMRPGTLVAHVGAGGASVAGFGGFGVEGQLRDDLAVGFDVTTGGTTTDAGLVMPSGTLMTAQYNPNGWDDVAIRVSGGLGVDALPGISPTPVSPWLGGSAGVVTSTAFGPLTPYLAINLGARRAVGGPDGSVNKVAKIVGTGVIDNTFSAGATGGVRFDVSDALGVYASASLTAMVFTLDGTAADVAPTIVQSSNGQIGISYSFDVPN